MTSTASWPVSFITSATVRLSQRRFSGRRKAPSRTSAQPAGLAYDGAARRELGRSRSRAVRSARRALSGPGPPAWIHCGSWISSRVLAHSDGIGVEGDVEALGARVVDQREQRLGAARVGLAVVEVGDVGGRVGPPADLDRLAERVEVAVAERVADVGVVEAAVRGRPRR